MTNETEIYWCQICQTETMTANPTCPKCGIKMKTPSTVKSLGKLIIFLGGFLALLGGLGVLIGIAFLLFTKDAEKASGFFGCLPVLIFGIVGVIRGIRQAKSGRSNKTPMKF